MMLLRVKQFLNIIFTEGDFMRYYAEITTKVVYETDTEKMNDIKEEIRQEIEAA